jgi:RNA polymerase sigma-70 factor, ECF subfamily
VTHRAENGTLSTVTGDQDLGDLTGAAAEFGRVRPRLFGIAYRMLGTVADAEDVVQDAWLRWQHTDRTVVRDPAAFLATTTTRLAITAATSARARREVYVGTWLPEPVPTADDPALGAERAEALDLAVLLLLERLPPTERAVYVLREAFAYPFRRIAEILEIGEANARQLAKRARGHITGARRASVSAAERDRLLRALVAAARSGDLSTLEGLLARDAVSYSDGGGLASAARRPVEGRERVMRFLAGIALKETEGLAFTTAEANGGPALVVVADGAAIALLTIRVSDDGVDQVLIMRNPEKLGGFSPAG